MGILPLLTSQQLAAELSRYPGLIPVSIRPMRRQIVWLDLDTYHFYEGFFRQSLNSYQALCKSPAARFLTEVDVLKSVPLNDHLPPFGFIFHAGRCGSTLLAKILARSRANMVFSEAGPHNQIWRLLRQREPAGIELYRNLILAMARRRVSTHRAFVIKFTSFNILEFEFIRAAFPDVPALFLFRSPAAMLDSYRRKPPKWLLEESGPRRWESAADAIEDFFRSATSIKDRNFRCFAYENLNILSLPAILRFLRLDGNASELRQMGEEFQWDAKRETRHPFRPAVADQISVPPRQLLKLYSELCEKALLDWVPQ